MTTDRDKKLIEHIFVAIKQIEKFVEGKSQVEFEKDDLLSSAVIKKFEIIGMRNILIHDYFGTDLGGVWNSIVEDLPKLKERLND